MFELREFLLDLDHRGVRLWVDAEQLRVKAPQGVLTPPLVKQIQDRKADIVAFLRQTRPVEGPRTTTPIGRADRANLPLSFDQQRFWFLNELGAGAAYNLPGRLVLGGPLDVPALLRAIEELVSRHEVLRTTFHATPEGPRQVVHEPGAFPLPVVDLAGLGEHERKAKVADLELDEARRPFDLSRDLMLRARLLRLSVDQHELLFTVHHIAADAWSMNILTTELGALYAAFVDQKPSPLRALPIQYGDFAAWQRGKDLEREVAFWKRTLKKPLPVLELPFDFEPPEVQDHRGGRLVRSLSLELSSSLRSFAREAEATPFVVLLAVFDLLLHRQTGLEDIIIGTPSIGRGVPETEGLIGLFLNLVALRTDLSGNPTFRELVRRAKEVTFDAFAHQDAPFEKIVELIQPDRRPGRDPIFEVMLNYVNIAVAEARFAGLDVAVIENAAPDALRALTLYAYDKPAGLELELVYQRALFSHERMVCLLDQFVVLLGQTLAEPDRPLPSYSLVTEAARALLPDMSAPLPAYPLEPITMRLRAWAQRTPEAIAVETSFASFSYAELWDGAERIARGLLAAGLSKGQVVAVHGSRSFGMVAALFGTLLAGGVILPISEELPVLRQEAMLRIGRAQLVVAVLGQRELPPAHLEMEGRAVLRVDAETGGVDEGAEQARRLPEMSGEDPAYVMFTSGTTGEPKGILGVHQGLAHFLTWQREAFEVGPGDRIGQYVGLSFDVMLRDTFLAPTSGATLSIARRGLELDGAAFLDWLAQRRITLLHPVPSLGSSWISAATAGYVNGSLKHTFFAGEPLTDTLVRSWRRLFPATRIINLYGPAETTMAKCHYVVPDPPLRHVQPVGRPIPDTQALVLNAQGALAGIGELGQIVLRTPFRTRGYVNPEKNERKFVPNPARQDPDDLLYHSGDLGRYRPDGTIDILGRVDHEVKIRGVRIQPGEISAVLDKHPAVMASTIDVRGDDGDKKLVAYVVPRNGEQLSSKELRHWLGQRLQGAMIPSAFVFLEAIPVTPNGKVDRSALPPPVFTSEETFAVPRSELERAMVTLWQEVLGVFSVGIHDNFFELGGHSLIAVHLLGRIEQAFGQRLPLAVFFTCPTVEALAARLEKPAADEAWASLVPIQPKGRNAPFFCAPGAGGNVLYLYELARALGPDQPMYGLQARGLDGKTLPHTSVEAMAADYIAEIKRVQPAGPYRLGGHSFGGQVVLEMAQQLVRSGDSVSFIALLDSSPPIAVNEDLPAVPDEAGMLVEMASILGFMAGRTIDVSVEVLRSLGPEERLEHFQRIMVDAGLMPKGTDGSQVRGWLSVFKSNYSLWYEPREVRPVRTIYFCATEHDPRIKHRRLEGWRKYVPIEVHEVEGSHGSIMKQPHVLSIASRLVDLLQQQGERG